MADEERRRSEEARRVAFDYTRPDRTGREPVPQEAERAVGRKGAFQQATPAWGIGVWLRRTWHQAWDVPEGGTRTPRRFGVASIVVALIQPIVPLFLSGGGLVAFGVSLIYSLIGVILGMRGAGLANNAGQSPLLPRIGWGMCLFELVTGSWARPMAALPGIPHCDQRDRVEVADGRAVAGSAGPVWAVEDRP